jgi:Protein of unknown function (DUF3761)
MNITFTLLAFLLLHGQTAATHSQQALSQQNYRNCVNGYANCEVSQLSAAELARVQDAKQQRNYYSCLHGYSSCDLSKLDAAEKPFVEQAAHQRNYNNCLHGYSSCDLSKLDETEIASISKARSPNVTADSNHTPPTASTTTPHYYTNKDGIKVQSPTHYDSPPSGATAQCGDGTYSFSLNHRGTCSHHGGVARWLN